MDGAARHLEISRSVVYCLQDDDASDGDEWRPIGTLFRTLFRVTLVESRE